MVSNRQILYTRSNFINHAGKLMSQYDREIMRFIAVNSRDIAAANAAGHDLDPDLPGLYLRVRPIRIADISFGK